jgi:hypothetical protein
MNNNIRRYKMRKVCFLMISIFIISTFAFAQKYYVTGVIKNQSPYDITGFDISIVNITGTPLSTAQIQKDGSYCIEIPQVKEDLWITFPIENCRPIKKKITNKNTNIIMNSTLIYDGRGKYTLYILKDPDWN